MNQHPDPESLTTRENVIDELTEIMHVCRRQGIDFASALAMAEVHYAAERVEHQHRITGQDGDLA